MKKSQNRLVWLTERVLAAQYVTLQIKIWMKKSKTLPAGLAYQNGFGPAFLHPFLRLVQNRRSKALTPATREECNIKNMV